jgi:copper transport protein
VFSTVAFSAVGVLAVTGGYAAWRGVGTIHAIVTTMYGLLVSLKVLLFLGLVALGNVSRRSIARRASGLNRELVRRAVAVEVLIALGVLAATGALVAEPRGKEVLTARHLKTVSKSVALPDHRVVTVTVDPGTHGTVAASVALSAGAKPLSVTGTAALPKQQIGPIPLGLTAEGSNLYGASGVTLPAAGNWVFALVVRTDEFTATTVDVTIHLY